MSCLSCTKPFSLFRKEKGCPSCGFSYCSNCLNNLVFVTKLNREAKVCGKCARTPNEEKKIEPPDAYYKRLGEKSMDKTDTKATTSEIDPQDQAIKERLQKLKEDSQAANKKSPEEEISERLKKIKGEVPSTSDAEIQQRLANLRGVPISTIQSKPVFITPDLRTEQEQADDLLKQYAEQANIDNQYKDEFDALVSDMESRVQKLKGNVSIAGKDQNVKEVESEDEDEIIRKIVERAKVESTLEDREIDSVKNDDELPFCEICNEDARMRCLGCHYLYCKRCFLEHKDDEECNRYEPYEPPKH